ncbi:RNase adapter RapZ [Kocuria rhizophila]|nr:RNase adapter RapZ [Kocuria rhizophila]
MWTASRRSGSCCVICATADSVLDTTSFNVHALTKAVADMFSTSGPVVLRLTVMSFSASSTACRADANYVADVRFHPQARTGCPPCARARARTPEVRLRLRQRRRAHVRGPLRVHAEPVFAGYRNESKHYATIAIGTRAASTAPSP